MLSVLHANAFVLLVGLATEANVVEEGMMEEEEAGIGYVRLGKKKKKNYFLGTFDVPRTRPARQSDLDLGEWRVWTLRF